jgi:cysteine synthase A
MNCHFFSLLPLLLSKAVKVPDLGSVAAMLVLRNLTGVASGPSSGTNFLVTLHMAVQLREKHGANRTGAIATLLCDEGGRYLDTYYNKTWLDIGFKEKGGVKACSAFV